MAEYISSAIWIWSALGAAISNSKFRFFNTYGASQIFFSPLGSFSNLYLSRFDVATYDKEKYLGTELNPLQFPKW